jgi:hypothetical protein
MTAPLTAARHLAALSVSAARVRGLVRDAEGALEWVCTDGLRGGKIREYPVAVPVATSMKLVRV